EVDTIAGALIEAAELAPEPVSSCRPGKELVGLVEDTAGHAASYSQPKAEEIVEYYDASEKERGPWPIPHRISEVDFKEWEKAKAMLLGEPLGPHSPRQELSKDEKFVPLAFLDKETSILGSSSTPITAVQKFSLRRDNRALRSMPIIGLHLALKAYFLRGALLEQELFERFAHMHDAPQRVGVPVGGGEGREVKKMRTSYISFPSFSNHCNRAFDFVRG
ncbi:uncharacterized protein A4U43_C07F29940, partial [Asparagus officinalis]